MNMNQVQAYSSFAKDSRMNGQGTTIKSTDDVTTATSTAKEHRKKLLENSAGVLVEALPAAVYDRSDIAEIMKKDAEARMNQFRDMIASELKSQAGISVGGDDVWKYLASGKMTVNEAAQEKAKELISEDGYYGVKQTSDRILKFAQALSGGDKTKADTLLHAFEKGYASATKTWGKELPDICKQTYDAVHKKFNDWMKEDSTDASLNA